MSSGTNPNDSSLNPAANETEQSFEASSLGGQGSTPENSVDLYHSKIYK